LHSSEELVQHDICPNVASWERIPVKTVLLVSFVTLEKNSPFVDSELGMRNVGLFVGWERVERRNCRRGRKDERSNGLVELVYPVVREGRRLGRTARTVACSRVDLVLRVGEKGKVSDLSSRWLQGNKQQRLTMK
jgi:hypothetical protein